MEEISETEVSELKVEIRKGSGKGVARKLRRAGMIPAVFYGHRHEPVSLTLDPNGLVTALSTPKLLNTLMRTVCDEPDLNGRLVMVKEIQRHPLTRSYLHVDLIEVYTDLPVHVMVPVNVNGHAPGVEMGGTLDQHFRFVGVRCAADKIPACIELDVSELQIGDSIKISELSLGEGIHMEEDEHAAVVSVVAPRVIEEAAEAAVEGEEEAAEGAEAKGDDRKGKEEAKGDDKKGKEGAKGDDKKDKD